MSRADLLEADAMSSEASNEFDVATEPGRIWRRAGGLVAFAAVAVLAVWTLPGIDEVRDRFKAADLWWMAAAALCSLVSMFGFVRALWAAFERLVRWRRAVVLGFAEQAANVLLPVGGVSGPALGALLMRRAGVPAWLADERHAVLFLSTSFVSFFALLAAGLLLSLGVLPGDVSLAASLIPAVVSAAVIAGATAFALSKNPPASVRGRVRSALWRVRVFVHNGARATVELIRHGDSLLILGAITYYAADVAALACSFQAFGGGAPPLGVFVLAYTLGHAGALLPTPGGIGGTEGGLIGLFVACGTPLSLATAAVLGYRVFQLGLPAILGGACLLRIRHYLSSEVSTAAVAAHFAGVERLAAK
jgi:uncharacterized membrane protein YbhN (UPF0104 family)